MAESLMRAALEHYGWATTRMIDTCDGLAVEQLEYHMTGTFGSIIQTLNHLVESDGFYLAALGVIPECEPLAPADFQAMRARVASFTAAWRDYVASNPDPDEVVVDAVGDGESRHRATVGVRLAQVLHHGSDHRSQICSALSALRLEVPEIDVWAYAHS